MATKTWLDVDGDWSNVANWGGSLPVDDDDVVIAAGSKNITAGLNQSGINLHSLSITSGYTGNI